MNWNKEDSLDISLISGVNLAKENRHQENFEYSQHTDNLFQGVFSITSKSSFSIPEFYDSFVQSVKEEESFGMIQNSLEEENLDC